MKDNKEYYGIYLNGKIPKTKDKEKEYNKYYRNIKLELEGKAFLLDNKNEEIKEKLENKSKLKKQGKYTIKFINNKNEIYYINVQIRKLWLVCLFFIVTIFIILGSILAFDNGGIKQYALNSFSSFQMDLEGIKYVFDIGYKDTEFRNIELTSKVSEKDLIYPGTSGEFYILISTKNGNKDMTYSMQVQNEINKPQNLKFETEGVVYNSMNELSQNINGTISKNNTKKIKVKWFWEYETNDDVVDTGDGANIENYSFLIRMIGRENV